MNAKPSPTDLSTPPSTSLSLFLCGDVMTGRGIDQVLPHPSNPVIYESYLKDAREYVRLAERKNGLPTAPLSFSYIWGDALPALEKQAPDVRLINLETAVTKSEDYWKGKGINYRMHPGNVPCLTGAGIDCCSLANNHVLDWGYEGLAETLQTLRAANLRTTGAGLDRQAAFQPAILPVEDKGRVIVFAFGLPSSGIPRAWAATDDRPGINLAEELTPEVLSKIQTEVTAQKGANDLLVASIHWGDNWGYEVPETQITLARRLIDEAGFDLIHGHSSHHPKGIEVYRGKPIFYGCGDFLNDYEGISGYESFRSDLTLMYFVWMDPATGALTRLQMKPLLIRNFRLQTPSRRDARWLFGVMERECGRLGSVLREGEDGMYFLVV